MNKDLDKTDVQGIRFLVQPFLGRSMIEMLGVLAIVGVLSISGLMGYQKLVRMHHLNVMRDFISRIEFSFYENCLLADTCRFSQMGTEYSGVQNREVLCATVGKDMCSIKASPAFYDWYYHQRDLEWGIKVGSSGKHMCVIFGRLSEAMCNEWAGANWKHFARKPSYLDISRWEQFPLNETGQLTEEQLKQAAIRCALTDETQPNPRWVSVCWDYNL